MRLSISASALVCAIVLPALLFGLLANDKAFASANDFVLAAAVAYDDNNAPEPARYAALGYVHTEPYTGEVTRNPANIPAHAANLEFAKQNDAIPRDEVGVINTDVNFDNKETAASTVAEAAAKAAADAVTKQTAPKETKQETAKQETAKQPPAEKKTDVYTDANGKKYKKATYIVTAYTLSYKSCGKYPDDPAYGITASGKRVKPHYTLSAPKNLPFGTKIRIPAYEKFYGLEPSILAVQDRGSSITTGKLDIYFESEKDAIIWGRRKVEIHIYI